MGIEGRRHVFGGVPPKTAELGSRNFRRKPKIFVTNPFVIARAKNHKQSPFFGNTNFVKLVNIAAKEFTL